MAFKQNTLCVLLPYANSYYKGKLQKGNNYILKKSTYQNVLKTSQDVSPNSVN